MPQTDSRLFIYCLDPNDKIARVNAHWIRFARENAAGPFDPEKAVGQPIWNFIQNPKVQHLYKILFNRARQGRRIRGLPYRCDSPDTRRFMEMDLLCAGSGSLVVKNRIAKQERRSFVPLLSDFRDMSDQVLTICSFCKKIRTGGDCWVEVEEAMKRLNLNEAWPLPQLSHGVCEDCFQKWQYLN
jgi:hypothetical protein